MPEIVNCPKCERKLKVPDTLIGQSVRCPTCGETFTATLSAPAPSRPAPAPEEEPPPERPRESSSRGRALVRRSRDQEDDDDDDDRDDRPRRRRSRYRSDLTPHRGTLILVLGIMSFFVAGPILGPIAWIMGNNDL